MALGVSVLHTNNIIHRDIKSLNMLVTDSYGIVLTDLGLSKIVDTKTSVSKQMHTQAVGTPLWMAPEVRDSTLECVGVVSHFVQRVSMDMLRISFRWVLYFMNFLNVNSLGTTMMMTFKNYLHTLWCAFLCHLHELKISPPP